MTKSGNASALEAVVIIVNPDDRADDLLFDISVWKSTVAFMFPYVDTMSAFALFSIRGFHWWSFKMGSES